MPNTVVGNSERAAGKPKKHNGLSKPKSEPPQNRIRNWRRFNVRDAWFPGAQSLRSLNIIFVSPSDWLRKPAHFYSKNNVAHRVVPLWFRAVHRVTDTGGVCGGAAHAGTWGCPCRERLRVRVCLGNLRASFDVGPDRRGGGRARFRTAVSGGNSAIIGRRSLPRGDGLSFLVRPKSEVYI